VLQFVLQQDNVNLTNTKSVQCISVAYSNVCITEISKLCRPSWSKMKKKLNFTFIATILLPSYAIITRDVRPWPWPGLGNVVMALALESVALLTSLIITIIINKCTKQQFIHLLTAAFKD